MLKKFCSILLSSVCALGVSNKKSDAGLGDIIKAASIVATTGVAVIANGACFIVRNGFTKYDKGCLGYLEVNGWVCPFYIVGSYAYVFGAVIDNVYDVNDGNNKNGEKNIKNRSQFGEEFSLLKEYKNKAKDKKR